MRSAVAYKTGTRPWVKLGTDSFGNRTSTQSGGDQNGNFLRTASYTNNSLNQVTSRSVPGYADLKGVSIATNTVTVNGGTAYRKGEYFRKELSLANTSSALWSNIVVAATGQTSITGSVYLAKSPEIFSYDLDGNLTNDGRWAYTWDAENRLIGMTNNTGVGPQYQVNFAYDYQGRRIQKLVSTNGVGIYTNSFLYDGWNLVAELNPTNGLIRSYLWGTDLSGSMQGAGGVGGLLEANYYGSATTNCFPAFDGNGNVAGLINAADGTIVANYEYGPFGEPIRITGAMAKNSPFLFSTKYYDSESGLYYYGHRFYNPSTGTWPNRDPIREVGGKNLYGFVGNNPVSRSDKLGLIFFSYCGECKKGNVRYVHYAGYSLTAFMLGGGDDATPGTLAAAYDVKSGADVIGDISEFGDVAAGLAAEEVAKEVAAAAAKAGIEKGQTWNWNAAIEQQLENIEQDVQNQYGVDLWIRIDWQKCQEVQFLAWGDGTGGAGGFTSHLDWVLQKNVWYKSGLSGANRPEGGFDSNDTQGILNAVPPTIIEAIPALVH